MSASWAGPPLSCAHPLPATSPATPWWWTAATGCGAAPTCRNSLRCAACSPPGDRPGSGADNSSTRAPTMTTDTTSPCITLDREGGTAILTLCNSARRNAFTKDMRRDLTAKLLALQSDRAVHAIILTGAAGHFCTGADVSGFGAMDISAMEARVWLLDTNTLLRAMADGIKPVICAIAGDCIGAGLSLALLGDFMIVSRQARLGAFFARIGLLPDMGI